MFRNYLLSAFRFFLRNKGFTVINIIGLALGIACTVLIFLYVYDEMRFDRYHENWKRIYMVCVDGNMEGDPWKSGWTTPPMAFNMKNNFPEIENVTRLCLWHVNWVFKYNEKQFVGSRAIGADSTVFDIFTIPFILGDPATALNRPNTMVLTESTARKYFGDENPIGKIIINEDGDNYEITGVVEGQPVNSHFYFDMMYSIITMSDAHSESWFSHEFQTYLLLPERYDFRKLENKFDDFVIRYVGPYIEQTSGISIGEFQEMGYWYHYWLLPLKDVHLSQMIDEQYGTKTFIYILSFIGIFILLIACINYMNLATALAANRSKEVGIRKMVGSSKNNLIKQYLGESVILCLLALCFGMLFVELSIPYFNEFTGKDIAINYLGSPLIIPGLILFALLLGIMAGFYPSILLSTFKPVTILKGMASDKSSGSKSCLRNILVVFQFTICIIIIFGTIIVTRQLWFMQNKELGLESEQVLVLHRANGLGQKQQAFKQELLKNPSIINVTCSYNTPARHHNPEGHHVRGNPEYLEHTLHVACGDADFVKTLGLEIIKGRNFDPNKPTDKYSTIINESAVRFMELENPFSTSFDYSPEPAVDSVDYHIIGVVKDFHFKSLHHEIEPWILYPLSEDIWWYAYFVMIKINTENIQSTLKFIKDKWDEFTDEFPYQYSFLDEDFDSLYQKEKKARKMFTVFAVFTIIIACLGLLGLASFTANQRTKEIGIRKAMGSTTLKIQLLLSGQFSKLVFISIIIALPVAFYLMSNWLKDFAYRIDMPWWIFIVTPIVVLSLALLTISSVVLSAANRNPVDTLRYE
jgi:putative ABC transport system permease protein